MGWEGHLQPEERYVPGWFQIQRALGDQPGRFRAFRERDTSVRPIVSERRSQSNQQREAAWPEARLCSHLTPSGRRTFLMTV
jgi:hypothetical protein